MKQFTILKTNLLRTTFIVALAFCGLFGVNEMAWGADCNYITNQAGTVSSYVSGGKGTFFNPYKYKLNQYTSLGSISNTYGVDKISCSVTLESVFGGKSATAIVQYSTDNSTWSDVGSAQEISNGNTKTFTKSNCAIAAGETVYFRVYVTSTTEYGQSRSMSTSLTVRMAKSMSANSTAAINFGSVVYGNFGTAQTRTITYSNVETGKTMAIALAQNSSDFTVSLNKTNLDCSGTVTATINFVPQSRGNKKDTAVISSTNGATSIKIPLSGTCTRPASSISMSNSNVNVSVSNINSSTLDLSTLMTKTGNGEVTYTIKSATGTNATTTTASIADDKKTFSATVCGVYTLQANQAETEQYEGSTSNEFTVTVNKLQPVLVFDNTDNPEIIYSKDVIEQPAARMYDGKVIDRNIEYESSDPSITGAIHVEGTTLTARDVVANEGEAVNVTITAKKVAADDLYEEAAAVTHNYAVRAKRSPHFTMDTYVNVDASKTLSIGGQAIITYDENTDANLNVGTASEYQYITYVHDAVNRTITVTGNKGALAGNGVQTLTITQPGTDSFFPRSVTYTFTVVKKASALSLADLTTAMNVEDTVATPYTGLANMSEDVSFSCSPEGSMKMENGKLIALQAGTSTVTFSQPATEYWTGVSQSKTITVSKNNPNLTTKLSNRHPWFSIIEHPFKSLNTEKALSITSSNESLAKYVAAEDKIYVYGTSGNVTFTVNQAENYKYNAVVNYEKTFEIFQPNNRLPMTLTSGNLSDYNNANAGGVSWNGSGVVVGSSNALSGAGDWSAKYVVFKFVGVPDKLSFSFENTVSIATQYGWHFYQSSNGSDWNLIKEYQDALMNASGGTSEGTESNLQLDPATQYIKLEYHGNYGGRFKNVNVTARKEIAPKAATTDFGLGYNGNDPTARTIKVDWYNVKPCTVTITGADADKFVLGEGSATINSMLDNYGTADLTVSYKHETNTETSHTANLHIEDEDGYYANITLSGQTTPAPQDIIWRNDLTPMPIVGSFQNAAMVTTGQAVTLISDHPEIVRVVDNTTTLEPVSAGNARVTATAAGNNKWAETTSFIDIEVTTKNIQFIIWNDNLSNRKREDGKTVNIPLNATSSADLDITYELDEAAQAFASISGSTLTLTGWGKGQVIAKQIGNEDYVAVQAVKSLVSRNPAAGCRPLVGEYSDEYTLHTLAEKKIELNGEPDSVTFWAKCDWNALYGMWVAEEYDGYYHDVQEISRLGNPNITSSYQHYSFPLHRNATAVKLYTKTGATMTRTFKEVEVVLAKYLELEENPMNFSQVDKGSTKTQSFYINYSNLTGVLDVEMENTENTQFTVLTTTVGEDCGDAAKNARVDIRFTGSTLGTEENAIIVHNNDQSLRVPVSATVVLPSQTITWDPETDVLTTDDVVLSATATSELPVSFTSGNESIAEVVYEAGVYSLDIKSYGDVAITAHQAGNEDWSPATDKTITFHISRVVPVVETWPTAQVILPNTVGGATLIGGVKPEGIAGSFQWEDESQTVTRQAHTFNVEFVPSNPNYYETVSYALEIEILKTPQSIDWSRDDESDAWTTDVIILDATATSGLPVTYHSSDSTAAYAVDAIVNEVAVKKLYVLKGGVTITLTAVQAGDETYAAAPNVQKQITLNKVTPTIVTAPTATDMYIHHFLSNSTPQGGVAKVGGETINGVFAWVDGTELMDDPGPNSRAVEFRPYNSDYYTTVSTNITVKVQRFAPLVDHTYTTDTEAYGTALSAFTIHGTGKAIDGTDPAHEMIEGTFAWKDASYVPSVTETTAKMVFSPTRSEWYDEVEFNVPITVTPIMAPEATATASIYYGQVLSEAVLTNTTAGIVGGIVNGVASWDESLDLSHYYTVGTHELPIRFMPNDPNYEAVEVSGTAVLTVTAGYVFNGANGPSWDEDGNWMNNTKPGADDPVVIMEDVVITTPITAGGITISNGVNVTVKNGGKLTLGDEDSFVRSGYGNLTIEAGGEVDLGEGRLKVNDFAIETTMASGKSGQLNGATASNFAAAGEAYIDITLGAAGKRAEQWHAFTVPFPVDALNGIFDAETGDKLVNEVNYAIMDYHGDIRATGKYGWKKYRKTLVPGTFYIMTVDGERTTYRFKKKAGAALIAENSKETFEYAKSGDGQDIDAGWNGIGNPTLQYGKVNVPVQVLDPEAYEYVTKTANSTNFVVGTPFFYKAGADGSIMMQTADAGAYYAPARRTVREIKDVDITFGNEAYKDHLYISASEEALDSYEQDKDLVKMRMSKTPKVAQIMAKAYGCELSMVNAPMVNDEARYALSLYAPAAGEYTISCDAMALAEDGSQLYLTYNGYPIWNLSSSPMTVTLPEGNSTQFGLKIVRSNAMPTGIEEVTGYGLQVTGAEKMIMDGKLFILRDGVLYDGTGRRVR